MLFYIYHVAGGGMPCTCPPCLQLLGQVNFVAAQRWKVAVVSS